MRLLLIFVLCLGARAACHVMTPSGSGTHSGADWNNALAGIPDPMTRGDKYYMADGTYTSYTFSTADSGTSTVTLIKAIASDHCTDTGWNTGTMGSATAVIPTQLNITTDYLVVNGQTRSSATGTYGIKVDGSAADPAWDIIFGSGHNTVSYVELVGRGSSGAQDNQDELIRCNGGANNSVSYAYIHDSNNNLATLFNGCDNITLDNIYWARDYSTPSFHGQGIELGGAANGVVSNSVFVDIIGTGFIAGLNSSTNNGWQVYNTVFYTSNGNPLGVSVSPLMVGCADSSACSNWTFVQNSVVNVQNSGGSTQAIGPVGTGTGTGWTIENNLWYIPGQSITFSGTSGGTEDYNSCLGSGCTANWPGGTGPNDTSNNSASDPFVSWTTGNFNLATNVGNGVTLSSPYNVDPNGTTRTPGANWSRGAYQSPNAIEGGGSVSDAGTVSAGGSIN